MIDIHSHIIPGVDDGASSMRDSLKMAAMAQEQGITAIIASPHYIDGLFCSDCNNNKRILEKLKLEIIKLNIKIDILLGNEIMASYDLPDLIKSGKATTLNNSRYLLMELPFLTLPPYLYNLIFNLRLQGYTTILAHPERNERIMENPGLLLEAIRLGALVQTNASSIVGEHGRQVRKSSILLLKHNMIHFIATDAHSANNRISLLQNASKIIAYYYSKERLHSLLYENPANVIDNRPIRISEPIEIKKKRFYIW